MADAALEREAIRLFERLLDIPEDERDHWITLHAGIRPELRARLAALRDGDRRAALRAGAASAGMDQIIPDRIGANRSAPTS